MKRSTDDSVAADLSKEYPVLWAESLNAAYREQAGIPLLPVNEEVSRAMREIWLARTNASLS